MHSGKRDLPRFVWTTIPVAFTTGRSDGWFNAANLDDKSALTRPRSRRAMSVSSPESTAALSSAMVSRAALSFRPCGVSTGRAAISSSTFGSLFNNSFFDSG